MGTVLLRGCDNNVGRRVPTGLSNAHPEASNECSSHYLTTGLPKTSRK
jgi:hypothetical protein